MEDVLMGTLFILHPPSSGQEARLQEASTIFTSSGAGTERSMAKRKQMPPWPLPGQPESRQPQPVHPVPPARLLCLPRPSSGFPLPVTELQSS